ncbi:MAG: hypothetical protein J5750_00155 [Clostridiales bacterium]|nr:hypothetical protein [Clostridiales bacterium]
MKGFTISNLIIHMLMVLAALFLAVAPSGAALIGSVLVVFLPFLDVPNTAGALMIGIFFVAYALLSLIFGIVDFLVISKHPRAYFIIELLLALIGAAGCTMALIFYYEITSFPVRLLISRGIGPILTMAGCFLFLCLLNLAFTVLFAVIPRKKISPVPVAGTSGGPGLPGAPASPATIAAAPSTPLVSDSSDTTSR